MSEAQARSPVSQLQGTERLSPFVQMPLPRGSQLIFWEVAGTACLGPPGGSPCCPRGKPGLRRRPGGGGAREGPGRT